MCLITSAITIGGATISALAANIAAGVAAVATVASTAMGIAGNIQQGQAAQAQANYQAQIAKNNAKIAQNNADMKRQEGIEEARTLRLKNIQKIGAQQAAMAANGFEVNSGTNLDIIGDSAATGELDAITARYNKETQALAYEQQANNFSNQAYLDTISGQNAYKSGITSAIGTGLNGIASVSGIVSNNWYKPDSIGTKNIQTKNKISGGIKGDNITFA